MCEEERKLEQRRRLANITINLWKASSPTQIGLNIIWNFMSVFIWIS